MNILTAIDAIRDWYSFSESLSILLIKLELAAELQMDLLLESSGRFNGRRVLYTSSSFSYMKTFIYLSGYTI